MKFQNVDKNTKFFFRTVLVSLLDRDHMLLVYPYADRADILIVSYNKIWRQRTLDTFCSLYSQYMVLHEHSMCLFDAEDYFCTAIDYRDIGGVGVRQIRKLIPINNLSYHLRTIQRKFGEGKLV